jgi:hypothetical protein
MIALDRLQQIIPADQALANKALSVSLQGLSGSSTTTSPSLATATPNQETTKNLPQISALTEAVPASVADYLVNTYPEGTGQYNTLLIIDLLGTPSGQRTPTPKLLDTVALLNAMGVELLTEIYGQMINDINGVYNVEIPGVPPDPETGDPGSPGIFYVNIPDGPAAGIYPTQQAAFNALIAVARTEILRLSATEQGPKAHQDFIDICDQLIREQYQQSRAFVDFRYLRANDKMSIYSFVYSLPQYGLNTIQYDVAWYLEQLSTLSIAQYQFTAQAVLACMREGRNNATLSKAGIGTNSNIPSAPTPTPPQATLLPSKYTASEAARLLNVSGSANTPPTTWVNPAEGSSIGTFVKNIPITPVQLTATAPDGNVHYTVSSGSLPTGLTLGLTTGLITGTPTSLGTAVSFVVVASSLSSQDSSRQFTWTVEDNAITWTSPPPDSSIGTFNQNAAITPVQLTATATGGAVLYKITSGYLPTGLVLGTTTGLITGTPTYLGTNTNFTVTARPYTGVGTSATRQFNWSVIPVTTWVSPADGSSIGTFNQNAAITPVQLTATATSGTVQYTITSGSLPTGLTLGLTTGQITGTPTELGTSTSFTVSAVSSFGGVPVTHSFTWTVVPVTTWASPAANSSIGTFNQDSAITPVQLTATATSGNVQYTISGNALPTGLTLGLTTGNITGTPTQIGNSVNFTANAVSNLGGVPATRQFNWTVIPVTTWASPAEGSSIGTFAVNAPITLVQLTATTTGGTVQYTVTSGSLPTGLTLGLTTGQITGTPTQLGINISFTVSAVSDGGGVPVTRSFKWSVTTSGTTWVSPAANSSIGTFNRFIPITPVQLTATTTTGTVQYTITSGSLPTGLTLGLTTGQITGTPTSPGFNVGFTVSAVSSAGGAAVTRSFTWTVLL